MTSSLPPPSNSWKEPKSEDKPFFVWLNTSRMHMFTRLRAENRYLALPYTTEHDLYGGGMIEHDRQVGALLETHEKDGCARQYDHRLFDR